MNKMAKLKKPITIESEVKVDIDGNNMVVSGPLGSLTLPVPQELQPVLESNMITFKKKGDQKDLSLLGLYYSLTRNAVTGVKSGWHKTLEMIGVGYRAQIEGNKLTLHVGFSHPVPIIAPEGISFKVSDSKITVTGINKYLVGEIAATIRRVRPPEPYKGKGIRYLGETIRKKVGKAAKAVGGAPGK